MSLGYHCEPPMVQTSSDHTGVRAQLSLELGRLATKNTFIDMPAEDDDDGMVPRTPPTFSAPGAMLAHYETAVAMVADAAPADAAGADVEEVAEQLGSLIVTEVPLEIDLATAEAQAPAEGEWSIGSALHELGKCKPCAHIWKPGGCPKAIQCTKCHLCPQGEIEARKKKKDMSDPKLFQNRHKPLVEPAYVQPVSFNTGLGTSDVDMPSLLLSTPLPQKNTFIHFENSTEALEVENGEEGGPRKYPSNPPLLSAPGLMLSAPFTTKFIPSKSSVPSLVEGTGRSPQHEDADTDSGQAVLPATSLSKATARELHEQKECKPCAYFYFKSDGCRNDTCDFCHLCDKGEIKRRKRQRVKELKAAGAPGR